MLGIDYVILLWHSLSLPFNYLATYCVACIMRDYQHAFLKKKKNKHHMIQPFKYNLTQNKRKLHTEFKVNQVSDSKTKACSDIVVTNCLFPLNTRCFPTKFNSFYKKFKYILGTSFNSRYDWICIALAEIKLHKRTCTTFEPRC